jgi:hypothetical protein
VAYYFLIWRTGLVPAAIVGGAMLAAIAAHRAIFALAKRRVWHKVGQLIESIVRYGDAPSRLIMPLLAVLATLPWLTFTNTTAAKVSHGLFLILIGSLGWLGSACSTPLRISSPGNMLLRPARLSLPDTCTQVQVLRHIVWSSPSWSPSLPC